MYGRLQNIPFTSPWTSALVRYVCVWSVCKCVPMQVVGMYVTGEEAIRSSNVGANNFPTSKERLSSTLMASFNFRYILCYSFALFFSLFSQKS